MQPGDPPAAAIVSPARLFRLLLSRPRPALPISFRFRGHEASALSVRAIRSSDVSAATDAADDRSLTGDSRDSFVRASVIAAALTCDGGRVFASADDVLDLSDVELGPLTTACFAALAICSPLYGWSRDGAWHETLVKGARDPSNWGVFRALSGCVDVVMGAKRPILIERPDRYFGCPLHDLTDGQWMAYRAAVNDRRE